MSIRRRLPGAVTTGTLAGMGRPKPRPGDVCIGCEHRPEPEHGSYYYMIPSGMEFERPDGTKGIAVWLLLCGACHTKHSLGPGGVGEALRRREVRIACDLQWPESVDVSFVSS